MLTLDNVLNMERCESCDREVASEWKYCIYCGRPTPQLRPRKADKLPAAFRPEVAEPSVRKYDAPFWVGVAMGVLGLALIIYAAVQIYGSYA
jgi:hypothetical protein